MGENVQDAVYDAALNHIKTNCAKICVCSSEPTTYAEATSTYKLASTSLASSAFGSPANGDVSGRKIAIPGVSSISVASTGSAGHVALVTASALMITATCSAQSLTSGNKVNTPTFDIEFADPA